MPLDPEQRRARARIAATKRHNPDADISELARDFRASRAEDYVRRLTSEAPALTADQLANLAALLDPDGRSAA